MCDNLARGMTRYALTILCISLRKVVGQICLIYAHCGTSKCVEEDLVLIKLFEGDLGWGINFACMYRFSIFHDKQ